MTELIIDKWAFSGAIMIIKECDLSVQAPKVFEKY